MAVELRRQRSQKQSECSNNSDDLSLPQQPLGAGRTRQAGSDRSVDLQKKKKKKRKKLIFFSFLKLRCSWLVG